MKSDTLVTILLSVLAVIFGIVNARVKKRNAETRPLPSYDPYSESDVSEEEVLEEASPATAPQAQHYEVRENERKTNVKQSKPKKYGINAKQAVLFSEILKPKFDEFG